MQKEIGGYFELELKKNHQNTFPHSEGALLNSGKNALEYILKNIPNVKKIWLSFYTCDTVLIPIKKLGLAYNFYRLNEELEIIDDTLELGENEYVLYHNYFGIKDNYINHLYHQYGESLILDYAQSFCSPYIEGSKAFYSCRKTVGVPDGGVAFPCVGTTDYAQDFSNSRFSHLLKRVELSASDGYCEFKNNNKLLWDQPILLMSELTKAILNNIDFAEVVKVRRTNFNYLNTILSDKNKLGDLCEEMSQKSVPAFYPFLIDNSNQLRQTLIDNKVFVATYWPNVTDWLKAEPDSVEYIMSQNIIPLPMDQRYGKDDMDYIVSIIKSTQ